MDLRAIRQLFSVRDFRNAVAGSFVVVGGLSLAGLTLFAHQLNNPRLAGLAAGLSLIFVLLILIFIVPPLARNASREASQLNLPFDLTLGGGIMTGLIAIVGFSAWNTGNNLLFLVFSFMVAAMAVGFVAGRVSLKKLDVKMRFPETIIADEETHVFVSIQNRKRFFSGHSVVAEVRGTVSEESAGAEELRRMLPPMIANWFSKPPVVRRTLDYFVTVPRGSTVELRSIHKFEHRGRFLIKDFEVSTKFPFAFFRHRRRLTAKETELMVLPKIEQFWPDTIEGDLEMGRLVSTKRGSGQELLSLRDYHSNDDIRRVDWKATARAGSIIVREFAAEDDKRVTVFFDDRNPYDRRSRLALRQVLAAEQLGRDITRSARFERAVRAAASVLAHFNEEQAELRLIIGNETGPYGVGNRHFYECLRRLALVEPKPIKSDSLPQIAGHKDGPMDEAEATHYYVVSLLSDPFIDEEIAANAVLLKY